MDDQIALRIGFDGHQRGHTPAAAAVDAGWRSLVVTPVHTAGGTATPIGETRAAEELRTLTTGGVRLVWDGRGTGSWVDEGRARLGALERARSQVHQAASIGAAVVVLGCGEQPAAQPADARWDQLAAGLSELAYEAELAGVQLALEAQSTDAVADLDVIERVVLDPTARGGVRVALDHSGSHAAIGVPERWWPEVAWIRLRAPEPGLWDQHAAQALLDARKASDVFGAAVVETAVWGWEHELLPTLHAQARQP